MLVNEGVTVKYGNGRLRSPINAAAASGKFDMLEFLVSNDTNRVSQDPEIRSQCKDAYGYALISAITESSADNRLRLVKLLVENGADANFEAGSGLYNRPLTAAAAMNSVPVVEYLLQIAEDRNTMINAESGIYGSALRAALSVNARETANYLIEHDANISPRKDSSFGNFLHLAVFSNMTEIVGLLLSKGLPVNLGDEAGQTALHIAAYLGYEAMVALLLGNDAEPNW
jgi:ankyrin repeat protein